MRFIPLLSVILSSTFLASLTFATTAVNQISSPHKTLCSNGNYHYLITPDVQNNTATICYSESGGGHPVACSAATTESCPMVVNSSQSEIQITCPGVAYYKLEVITVNLADESWSEYQTYPDGTNTPVQGHSVDGCKPAAQ